MRIILTTLAVALFAFGCSDGESGGETGGVGAALGCAPETTCTGGVQCQYADGDSQCVALPEACDGAATCACLGADVCSAECTDQPGGGFACGGADACVPGESFPAADGCNTCVCPESGLKDGASCTLLGCPYEPCAGKACGDSCAICDPNDDDCATPGAPAYCDQDGQCVVGDPAALCEDPEACTPGETFEAPDGCNTCTCPPSGDKKDAACTDMACYDPCAGKACGAACSVCDPADTDCAAPAVETFCDADGLCGSGPPGCEDPNACTPGETFEAPDGCNTCTCPASGKRDEAACTEIACQVQCGGADPVFPTFGDVCAIDADCAIVIHQVDCCGSFAAWAVNAGAVTAFEAAEAQCRAQYPDCDCASISTVADDGLTGDDLDDFVAVCDQGECRSRVAGACYAGGPCVGGEVCYAPGQSIGCGACFNPEFECASDAECQGQDPGFICEQSTIDDCLCTSAMLCKPGCATTGCDVGEVCGDDQRCAPEPCTDAGQCPSDFACQAGGCQRLACSANDQCEGFCVHGACYSDPGFCSFPPP